MVAAKTIAGANAELTAKVRKHIQEHIDMLRDVNPDILMLIKEQPLNPMQQAGAPGLPPGPMNQAPPGQPGGPMGNSGAMTQATTDEVMNPATMGAQQTPASLPNVPKVDASLLPNPNMEPQ